MLSIKPRPALGSRPQGDSGLQPQTSAQTLTTVTPQVVSRQESSAGASCSIAGRNADLAPSAPFLRPVNVGPVLLPVPDNLAGKTCSVSTAMVTLMDAVSDDYLVRLQQKECPERIIAGRVGDDREFVARAWSRLRDSFCHYQMALRAPGRDKTLDLGLLINLIEACYVYGTLAGDQHMASFFHFGHTVSGPDDSNFLLDSDGVEQISQGDSEEFFSFLFNALDFMNPEDPWSGYFELQQTRHKQVGQVFKDPVAYSRPDMPTSFLWLEIPLGDPQDGSNQSETMQDLIQKRVVNSIGERGRVSQDEACQACEQMREKVRELPKSRISQTQRDTMLAEIDKFEKQVQQSWDAEALRPCGFTSKLYVEPGNDAMLLRLQVFFYQPEEQGSIDWSNVSGADPKPEDLGIDSASQAGKPVKEYYLTEGGTGKHYVYNVMSSKHAAAFRLSRAMYEMANYPVADIRPVNRGTKTTAKFYEGKGAVTLPTSHIATEILTERRSPNRFDYNPEHVVDAMAKGAWYKSSVVFDAWLGNVAVTSSRLAKADVPKKDGSGATRAVIYRTDFCNCMGFSKKEGDIGGFGMDASADLETLKQDPAFSCLSDKDIKTGIEQLSRIKDDLIDYMVGKYYSGMSVAERTVMANTLIARRDSLLAMKQYQAGLAQSLAPLARPMRGKRHTEAVSALASTDGEFEIPQVLVGGQNQPYQAKIRSVVCHQGISMYDGHYVAFREEGGEWMVSDDLLGQGGVLVSEYLKRKGREHLVDIDAPDGWDTLINTMEDSTLAMTPYMMLGQRMGITARPECEESFTRQRVANWKQAREAEQIAREAEAAKPQVNASLTNLVKVMETQISAPAASVQEVHKPQEELQEVMEVQASEPDVMVMDVSEKKDPDYIDPSAQQKPGLRGRKRGGGAALEAVAVKKAKVDAASVVLPSEKALGAAAVLNKTALVDITATPTALQPLPQPESQEPPVKVEQMDEKVLLQELKKAPQLQPQPQPKPKPVSLPPLKLGNEKMSQVLPLISGGARGKKPVKIRQKMRRV